MAHKSQRGLAEPACSHSPTRSPRLPSNSSLNQRPAPCPAGSSPLGVPSALTLQQHKPNPTLFLFLTHCPHVTKQLKHSLLHHVRRETHTCFTRMGKKNRYNKVLRTTRPLKTRSVPASNFAEEYVTITASGALPLLVAAGRTLNRAAPESCGSQAAFRAAGQPDPLPYPLLGAAPCPLSLRCFRCSPAVAQAPGEMGSPCCDRSLPQQLHGTSHREPLKYHAIQ